MKVSKILGETGFEPATRNTQSPTNKQVKEKPKNTTGQKLPKSNNSGIKTITETDPELKQIITALPKLPEHIKAAIKALIQTHIKE